MKKFVCILSIIFVLFLSVTPNYIVYASGEHVESQEVTSNDNIVQKILNYGLSNWGALNRLANSDYITGIDTAAKNRMLETIASLMNGGGIYIDENGDYVFTNEASQRLYDSMMNNSGTDVKVISDFSNFSYYADGYVSAEYITLCNQVTAWAKDISDASSGNYILFSNRYWSSGYIYTTIYAYRLPEDFGFLSINSRSVRVYTTSASNKSIPCWIVRCRYNINNGVYTIDNNSKSNFAYIMTFDGSSYVDVYQYNANTFFNAFPNFNNYTSVTRDGVIYPFNANYYCNNSLLFAKSIVAGNGALNQTSGIYSEYKNIGTINKNVIEQNNWEAIYNNYINNVNIDYQQNTSMTSSDLRKIMKKYTGSIIDAIQNGSANIEETISISNRYLQAISVDVRNISDKLDDIISGGGSGSGSGGGLTQEQYDSIMGKLNDINSNALDISSGIASISSDVDGSYSELQDISDNTLNTNTKLVAIDTLLQQINSKIRQPRNKTNPDSPLPDPDFWDHLDDDLNIYDNTFMEDLVFKLNMIGTVLQGVVPFGYVAVMGVILNALAVDPEPPVFDIELNSANTTIPVNWSGTIDLSWVDEVMPMVRALEVIVFILGMIWASFEIFTTLGSLFS